MSLKAFHVVFILAAIALVVSFGIWSLRSAEIAMGIGALALATGLALYLARFVRQTRHLPFLCAVCLGDPNSLLTQSANAGVWFLLGVVVLVLAVFAAIFLFWARSSITMKSCQRKKLSSA